MSTPEMRELAQKNKQREQQLMDNKLELLMSIYHKVPYTKVLNFARENGLIKPKSNAVSANSKETQTA